MNNKPTILITNDDSFKAKGIRKLIEIMKPLGRVIVVSTENVMSAQAHSITIQNPLRMKLVSKSEDYEEYVCDGTPVDCVKLGTQVILDKKPDLVVSGINHGSNASINIIYSGTMAAVIEACMDGMPAIGFSLLDYDNDAYFDHLDEYITKISKKVLKEGLPHGVCLNVNFPKVSDKPFKGIKVCRQADARWAEDFEVRQDPRGTNYYWLTGYFIDEDGQEDSDQYVLAQNYISIVPIHYDLTAYNAIKTIENWNL